MKNQSKQSAESKKKKRIPWGIIIFYGICLLIGVLLGTVLEKEVFEEFGRAFLPAMLFFIIGYLLHIIVHEAGHMVCGLATGYRFVSFRVASLMWEKQKNGKIRFSRFSLAGTGGQCLMAPPAYNEGQYPYRLYNLGGGLANFILSGICGLLLFLNLGDMAKLFLTMMMVSGIVLGAMNLIPIKKVNNDGSNIVEISKSEAARKAFWLQMRVNEEIANGIRMKDMPDEWFQRQEENRKNVMVTSIDVLAANRLMDAQRLDEAEKLMLDLMQEDCMASVYKSLLIFELSFLEMIKGVPGFYTEKTKDAQVAAFAKAMKNFPSVLRWQYAKAKRILKDEAEAERIKAAFDKMAATYPHPCEIEGERELMKLADEDAVQEKTDECATE